VLIVTAAPTRCWNTTPSANVMLGARRVWKVYCDAPSPLGFDFWSVFPDGPAGESPSLLRLSPFRLRLNDVETLNGRKESLAWP
jgi:hypothetical protein